MKVNKVIVAVMLVIIAIIVSIQATIIETEENVTTRNWYDNLNAICMGCGKIDEYEKINSVDAIKVNYQNGFRIFEMDLSLTSDSRVVLRKDWTTFSGQEELNINSEGTYIPSLEEFKKVNLYGKYTPTSLEDVINLMDEYNDMYIVIDISKKDSKEMISIYSQIMTEFKKMGKISYIDRVIAQLYDQSSLENIESVYHFKNYMYKIVKEDVENIDTILDFCNKKAIKTISVDWYLLETAQNLQNKINERKLFDYVFTVNDEIYAKKYISNGAKGIITNNLKFESIDNNQGEVNENKE